MSPLAHLIRLVLFWSFLYFVGKSIAEVDSFQWHWDSSGELAVSWNVHAANDAAPYTYLSTQLQWSADLNRWEGFGNVHAPADGDTPALTLVDTITVNETTSRGFFRVVAFASPTGTDYTGKDLSLTNVAGYNFNDADLSTTKFAATSPGAYTLTQLGGPVIPDLPYFADTERFDRLSLNTLIVRLTSTATVDDVNAMLAAHGGSVSGSITASTSPLVAMKFPETSDLSVIETALNSLPTVAGVARDIALSPMILSQSQAGVLTTPAPEWHWNEPTFPDGNWGLEWARIPQMWNFNDAIARLETLRPDTTRMFPTTILHDEGFSEDHWDIDCAEISDPLPMRDEVHGTQIAGILAAETELGGMEGVDPHIDLASLASPMTQFAALKAIAWLVENEEPRIINQSFAVAWEGANPNDFPLVQEAIDMQADWLADLLTTFHDQHKVPFIVVAAGNDGIDSQWAGAAQRAAREKDSRHIIVVGAQDRNRPEAAPYSNTNAEILAPGTDIMSTVPDERYDWITGTSAAAPHVAGVASYLLHLNPFLTNDDLKRILMKGDRVGIEIPGLTETEVLDAFAAVLTIDTVRPASEGTMLKMLLDIDDGSKDGNLRVLMPGIDEPEEQLEDDRSFDMPEERFMQTELEDYDEDDAPGDDAIDMADFRCWRDWLLLGETNALNGDLDHSKHDANRNGKVDFDEEPNLYPRGDFNGDGKIDRDSKFTVNGILEEEGPLTDLEVLTKSGYWSDLDYDMTELPGLIDSIDLVVSAQHLLETKAPEMMSGIVTLYDEATDEAVPEIKEVTLDSDKFSHLFTVPVGKTYYVASEPIEIMDDENHTVKVRMRSIDSQETTADDVGADYLVDLTKVERTAKVFHEDQGIEIIESDPVEEEVEAMIPEESEEPDVHAWANDEGTFFTIATTPSIEQHEIPPRPNETVRSFVRWQRSFEKDDDAGEFTFVVKPLVLELDEGINNGEEMMASAEIRVERRYFGAGEEWETVFHTKAKIQGQSYPDSQHSYRLEEHEGDVEASDLEIHFVIVDTQDGGKRTIYNGSCYRQETHEGTIPLDDIDDGHTFEVRYTLEAIAFAVTYVDGESAHAEFGDPLDYGGVTMEYGDFGEQFKVRDVITDGSGGAAVSHRSSPKFYFLLLDGEGIVVDMRLGSDQPGTLHDPSSTTLPEDYEIISIPIAQARDTDGDGMDDVFELRHPAILNPLDESDAQSDPDGDGLTNVAEYQRGSDPNVFDEIDQSESQSLFPGVIIDGSGTHAADLNNDGSLDFIDGPLRKVRMGNPDGTFQEAIELPLPYLNGKLKLAFLNDDLFVDIVATEVFKNEVTVLLGSGDGSFDAQDAFAVGRSIESVTVRDYNGDGKQDLLVADLPAGEVNILIQGGDVQFTVEETVKAPWRAHKADLGDFNADGVLDIAISMATSGQISVFLGIAGGGLEEEATDLNVGGLGTISDFAVADFNKDGRDDLSVLDGVSGQLSVFMAKADGDFDDPVIHTIGAKPSALRLADLNGDSYLDTIVAHNGSRFHMVMLGNDQGGFDDPVQVASEVAREVILADWNHDGHLDLIASVSREASVVVLGNGDGTFSSRDQFEFESWVSDMAIVNTDNDAELEIVGRRNDSIDVWKHGLSSGDTPQRLSSVLLPSGAMSFVVTRINDDAFPDLVVSTEEEPWSAGSINGLHFYLGDGDGGFDPSSEMLLSGSPWTHHAAELNGDTLPDLVVAIKTPESDLSQTYLETLTFLNQGDGTFVPSTNITDSGTTSLAGVRDIDGDGIDEAFLRSFDGSRWKIDITARNAADGSWDIRPSTSLPESYSETWFEGGMLIGKTNADRHLEIQRWPMVNGTFGEPELLHETDGLHSGQITVSDINGDGMKDILTTALGGITYLFLAESPTHWSSSPITFHSAAGFLQPVDLNLDSKMDLVGWTRFEKGVSLVLQK